MATPKNKNKKKDSHTHRTLETHAHVSHVAKAPKM